MAARWRAALAGGARVPLRARRRVGQLRPPATEPASLVWAAFDEDQQAELVRNAADDRHATLPDRAVVLAALQRQIEDRARRWTASQLLLPLAVLTSFALIAPGAFAGWWFVVLVVPWAFGLLAGPVQVTRARRANEQLAREGGYPVPADDRGTTWGIDRPVLGDPIVPVSAAIAALAVPVLAADLHPVVAAAWVFPGAAVSGALVLATGRAFVRGLREGRTRRTR